ncbi:MAG: hypothetical protein ABI204_00200 [Ginsengibacter sp.]
MKNFKAKIIGKFVVIIIVIVFFVSCKDQEIGQPEPPSKSYPNFLQKTMWIIANDKLLGVSPSETLYNLTLKADSSLIWNFSAIEFIDQKQFTSFNSWECGNDCFTSVYGHYEFTDNDKIKLYCDSIKNYGTCEAPTEITKNRPPEEFVISKNENKIILRKAK